MENYQESTDGTIDLREYLNLLLHWLWLIILITLLSGAAGYFVSEQMTPYYRSTVTIMVDAAPATKMTDYSSLQMSQKLTGTYSEIMTQDNILMQVIDQLNLNMTIEELKKRISVTTLADTQLIEISVETPDPLLSANIANTIAELSIDKIESLQSARFAESKESLQAQMSETEKQIQLYEQQADAAASDAEKQRLTQKINNYQQIYANLLQSFESIRLAEIQAVSTISVIEPAVPQPKPVKPKVLQNTIIAALVGCVVTVGILFLIEALNDTIKNPEEISQKYDLPILGVINRTDLKEDKLITISHPRSPTAEAYRALRTNINFSGVDKPLKTILVTSPEPGEGKSTTICNLATVMAQSGKRVTVVDCDLRHPMIHNYFNLPNRQGLSDLFIQPSLRWENVRQIIDGYTFSVVTSGLLPPNPAELLGSNRMQNILSEMAANSDLVILDTPPVLAVTDACVLAPYVDGVLVVVMPGSTTHAALELALEQLNQVNAKVLGIVVNGVNYRGAYYSYHYQKYGTYQKYYGEKPSKETV